MALVPRSLQIDIFVTNIPKDPIPIGTELGQQPSLQSGSKPPRDSWTPAKHLATFYSLRMSQPSTSMEDIPLDSTSSTLVHVVPHEERSRRDGFRVSASDDHDYNTLLTSGPRTGLFRGRYDGGGLKGKDYDYEVGLGSGHYQEDSAYDVLDYTHFNGDLDAEVVLAEESLSRRLRQEGAARRRETRKMAMGYQSQDDSRVDFGQQVASPTDITGPEEHAGSSPLSILHDHGGWRGSDDSGMTPDLSETTLARKQARRVSLPPYLQQYELGLRDPSKPRDKKADRSSLSSIRDSIGDVSAVQSMMPKTGKGARGEEMEIQFSEEELEDVLAMAEYAWPGHPMLDKLLQEEVEMARGAIVVACGCFLSSYSLVINPFLMVLSDFVGCGPTSLSASIRKVVAAQIDPLKIKAGDMRGYISCVTEEFEY